MNVNLDIPKSSCIEADDNLSPAVLDRHDVLRKSIRIPRKKSFTVIRNISIPDHEGSALCVLGPMCP